MSVRERDPLTGHQTTGHEWNGITELNTRVPPIIWWFIIVTQVWALIYWIMMPSWPLIWTYTGGLLGIDQKAQVEGAVQEARAAREVWATRVEAVPVAEIRDDPELMQVVSETGPALFGDNCAVCHGPRAAGGPGFPSLVDNDWLWGGDDDAVLETVRVGINAQHPETRVAEMLGFGRDGILSRDQVRTLAAYVQSLSGTPVLEEALAGGEDLFAENCAACHGEDGRGNPELGAPDLTDDRWIYGGDDATLFETIHDGRRGWMPAWEDRLSLVDRKILVAYLHELSEEQRQ
jgi:cytochrome c oxidase cbb3-type subunit 3